MYVSNFLENYITYCAYCKTQFNSQKEPAKKKIL